MSNKLNFSLFYKAEIVRYKVLTKLKSTNFTLRIYCNAHSLFTNSLCYYRLSDGWSVLKALVPFFVVSPGFTQLFPSFIFPS
jgi:hypothetical protein